MGKNSQWILLALAGFVCLLSEGSGAVVPLDDLGDDEVLSIDQILLKAVEKSNGSDPNYFAEKTHLIRSEYDMVYTPEEWLALHNKAHRQKRTAAVIPNRHEKRWTNNIVYYELERGVFGTRDRREIDRAINELSHYTCLKFVETTSAKNRVYLQEGFGGCYSRVGMVGGRQELGLSEGCRAKHVIIHELMHAIGVHHEQTRPDRDDHVTIRFDRIIDNMEHNFEKYDWDYVNTYKLPYDYLSVMHYGPTGFAEVSGQNTIETKDPRYQSHIGTNPGLSILDIRTLNNMHSCVPDSCTLTDAQCGENGFVGKDCKCWCPGFSKSHPVEYCYQRDIDENGSLEWNYRCRDHHDQCATFKSRGYCTNSQYVDSMLYYCEKTCNNC